MEIKQLLCFKRIAELENMTKAAVELMVSQPYLSKMIAGLESELGTSLFDRAGRRITLNPCGEAFYKRTVQIINAIEDAKKEIQNFNLSQQTSLIVATNISQFMPGLLELITTSNPDIKIRQMSAKKREIIQMLRNGETDFALCSPPIEESVDLNTLHLRYEQAAVIFPKGHWLEDCKVTTLADIKDESFIGVSQGYGARDTLDAYFSQLNAEPKIVIETTDTASVFRYVEKGLGIAAVPLSMVLYESAFKDRYSLLSNRAGGNIALSWRRNQYIGEAGKLFIEKSKEHFDGLEDFVKTNQIIQ